MMKILKNRKTLDILIFRAKCKGLVFRWLWNVLILTLLSTMFVL